MIEECDRVWLWPETKVLKPTDEGRRRSWYAQSWTEDGETSGEHDHVHLPRPTRSRKSQPDDADDSEASSSYRNISGCLDIQLSEEGLEAWSLQGSAFSGTLPHWSCLASTEPFLRDSLEYNITRLKVKKASCDRVTEGGRDLVGGTTVSDLSFASFAHLSHVIMVNLTNFCHQHLRMAFHWRFCIWIVLPSSYHPLQWRRQPDQVHVVQRHGIRRWFTTQHGDHQFTQSSTLAKAITNGEAHRLRRT